MLNQKNYDSMVESKLPKIKTILLATDGTKYAEPAFDNALHIAKQNEGRLVITFCTEPNYHHPPLATTAQWHDYGQKVLKRLSDEAQAQGVKVETVLANCQSESGMSELIDQVQPDLVMLGSELFHSN